MLGLGGAIGAIILVILFIYSANALGYIHKYTKKQAKLLEQILAELEKR